jgi:hypothetical protein
MGRRKITPENYDNFDAMERKFRWVSESDVVFTDDSNGIPVAGRRIKSCQPGYNALDRSAPITDTERPSCTQEALDLGRLNIEYFVAAGGKNPDKKFGYIHPEEVVTAVHQSVFLWII